MNEAAEVDKQHQFAFHLFAQRAQQAELAPEIFRQINRIDTEFLIKKRLIDAVDVDDA